MIIDNQKNIYRIWLGKLVLTLVFTISVIAILFLNILNDPEAVITKYHLIAAIAVVFLIISISGYLRDPYYFYFNDNDQMIIVRYYAVSIFNHKKNSIEIPKQHFVRFEIKKFYFGTRERLILYQHYRKKIAKYPPISLSAVDRADREKIKQILSAYSRKN